MPKALSLFLIDYFRSFSSLGGVLSPAAPPPQGRNATNTLIAIPIAVSMEAVVMPCPLNSVRIFSPNEVSLDKDTSLGEKIRTLFRGQGITTASMLTAIGMAMSVFVAFLPCGGGAAGDNTPPKDENDLK